MQQKKISILEKYKEKPSELIYVFLWIGFIYFLFNLPDAFLYSKNDYFEILIALMIFIISPLLIYRIFTFLEFEHLRKIATYSSVLILLPVFYFSTKLKGKADLDKNGVMTKGVISKSWTSKGRKQKRNTFYVEAEFEIEGKKYTTFPYNNSKDTLIRGDTVFIEYSLKSPDNSQIVILEKERDY